MSETTTSTIRNSRQTSRQRISTRKIPAEKQPLVTFPLLPRDQIWDKPFNLTKTIQKSLLDKHFKISTVIGGNITLPRYFQHSYYKLNRSPNEYNAALQDIKTQLVKWGFKPTPLNFHLYRSEECPTLYVYIKRYTQAAVLGLHLMRYYDEHLPTQLDLV